MSLWTGIKHVFGTMFGTPESTKGVFDTVSSGMDKLHFGDQERVEANRQFIDSLGKYMKNTEGQNVSRRAIVVAVIFAWLVCVLFLAGGAVFDADFVKDLQEIVDKNINSILVWIVPFYFSKPLLQGGTEKAKELYRSYKERKAKKE